MKNSAWPTFSFGEFLRPATGWKTDHAILATYSADLVAVVTSLLALSGCDLDGRRAPSRVEVVRAVEILRGRVKILAQEGRVVLPQTAPPILALLDRFLKVIKTDESESSWHPKAALVRFQNKSSKREFIWRVWVGSRNLTRSLNWESGLVVESRADGKGQRIPGLGALAAALAQRAGLSEMAPERMREEIERLTWECPAGVKVHELRFLGDGSSGGFPAPEQQASQVIVVSPFIDAGTLKQVGRWGHPGVRRVLLSTQAELNRIHRETPEALRGFELLWCNAPELPGQGADSLAEETPASSPETSEGEELPMAGLHAKLIYAASGKERKLWIGSANATSRGWSGKNFELVAELTLGPDPAKALEEFVDACQAYTPGATAYEEDADEEALEAQRKRLAGFWQPKQRIEGENRIVYSEAPPPIENPQIRFEVGPLAKGWVEWPNQETNLAISGSQASQQSELIQARLVLNERMCGWVQVAPFVPPIQFERDRSVIAEYLDPESFMLWLRSVLHDRPAAPVEEEWDSERSGRGHAHTNSGAIMDPGLIPTVEEILGAWARDGTAFSDANDKVKQYLADLEKRANETGRVEQANSLSTFRAMWTTLAKELSYEHARV